MLVVSGCGSGGSSTTTTGGSTAPAVPTTPTGASGSTTPTPAITPAPAPATGATPLNPPTKPANPADPATAAFIHSADQICAVANTELTRPQAKVDAALKAEQRKGTAANRKALAGAVRAEAAVASVELGRLRALSPPASDRATAVAYTSAVAGQVRLIDQLADAVDADDGKALTSIGDSLTSGGARVDQLASANGFKVCGSVSS
jgi:hypothetical protein